VGGLQEFDCYLNVLWEAKGGLLAFDGTKVQRCLQELVVRVNDWLYIAMGYEQHVYTLLPHSIPLASAVRRYLR